MAAIFQFQLSPGNPGRELDLRRHRDRNDAGRRGSRAPATRPFDTSVLYVRRNCNPKRTAVRVGTDDSSTDVRARVLLMFERLHRYLQPDWAQLVQRASRRGASRDAAIVPKHLRAPGRGNGIAD